MALSNAERQAKYRANHAKTHQKVEIVLTQSVYEHLQSLVKESGLSQQDFIAGLIQEKQPQPATQAEMLQGNDSPPVARRKQNSDSEPVQLWKGHRVARCQAEKTNGKACRFDTNLQIVSFTFRDKTYQALSCQQHKDNFSIHKNHF